MYRTNHGAPQIGVQLVRSLQDVQKALLDGKPIPASTPFGKGMVEIVERLGGKSQPAKKGSSLSGLLGLFSKTSK